jgi:hypothetical protein
MLATSASSRGGYMPFSLTLSPRGLDRSSIRKGMFAVPGKILERLNNTRRKQVQFFNPISLVCFILRPWGLGELERILIPLNPSQFPLVKE